MKVIQKAKTTKKLLIYVMEIVLSLVEAIEFNDISEQDIQWNKRLIKEGYIKWELVNFLLGKTFDRSLLLVNEAEQYTKENMRLILTRIGEYSKFVISGDARQVNRKSIINKQKKAFKFCVFCSKIKKQIQS